MLVTRNPARSRRALPPALAAIMRERERGSDSKPSKYRSRLTESRDHVLYDSQLECAVAADLELRLLAGEIARWSWGPRFVLQRDPLQPKTLITYRPDFIVWPTDAPWYALDAKGLRTTAFNLKLRLWKVLFPEHPLMLVKKDGAIVAA